MEMGEGVGVLGEMVEGVGDPVEKLVQVQQTE